MIPTPLAADVIDLARNQTRVLQAGAITVPMATATLKYARLSQDASAVWTAEQADIALSAAAFDSVTFTAHKLAALVAIDNELLEDAANADATIQNSIAKALALALDYGGLYGSGVSPQPQGLHGLVPTIASGGVQTNFDAMLRAIADAGGFGAQRVLYRARTAVPWLDYERRACQEVAVSLHRPTCGLCLALTNRCRRSGTGTVGARHSSVNGPARAWPARFAMVEVCPRGGLLEQALPSDPRLDQTVIRAILPARTGRVSPRSALAEVTGILAAQVAHDKRRTQARRSVDFSRGCAEMLEELMYFIW